MKLGLASINVGNMASPDFRRIAELAEELGYDSLWTAEHIVLPDLPRGQTERPGDLAFLDPIATLGYLAACTRTIKLATGVLLLPQHHPLLLAKQLASVDVLTRGRLIVGIGVGSVELEAEAMDISMKDRGRRANEYLEAMRAVWATPHPSYSGGYVSFEGINAYPRPVQKPGPPIVVGGRSKAAYRRAVLYGSGWYGFALTLEQTREQLGIIGEVQKSHQRPPELGELEITIAPREPISPETIRAYEALGVRRLLLRLPNDRDFSDVENLVRENAPSTRR